MRKEIGRIVDDILGRDIGHDQEDMQGVYTTGIEEIVGSAKAKAATAAKTTGGKAAAGRKVVVRRPAGPFPPMRAQPVARVPGRNPMSHVEIVDMPEMQIYSGPVDPRMQKLDPSTLLLLQMLRKDGPVRSDAAPIQRQRPVWPGSRGKYSY